MELYDFPTASYVLAQCVHYCQEAFTSTITLDPLKTACNARLNLSTALNLNSNNLIVITYASLLKTLVKDIRYRYSFVDLRNLSCGFTANIRCRYLIRVRKCLLGSSESLCPVRGRHISLLKWKEVLQIYAFLYCQIPCNQNHVLSPAEIGRIF